MTRYPVFLLLAFLLGMNSLIAQINVGLGFQQGYFKMDNADKPIDRFNQSGFLAREMRHFRLPGGEIYLASIRHNNWLLELNLNTRRARVSAESYSGSILNRRDIRFAMQAISVGGGYAVLNKPTLVIYGAAALDFGYMRLSTRMGAKETLENTPYYLVHRNGMIAAAIYAKFVFRANTEAITSWSLTPYFHYPFSDYDFIRVNTILLQPNQWYLDGTTLTARPWNAGLALNFDIDLLRLLM